MHILGPKRCVCIKNVELQFMKMCRYPLLVYVFDGIQDSLFRLLLFLFEE